VSREGGAKHRRVPVLGVPINALTMSEFLTTVDGWIAGGERHYVCTLDVHALMHSHEASDVRQIYRSASMVTPDGMPLVWLLRQAGYRNAERLCGPDLMPTLFEHSQRSGHRHFLYGSSEGTLSLLKEQISARFPNAILAGSYSPPYRELTVVEENDMVRHLNAANPDIVWVGLGAPKQDRWMAAYRRRLDAPVLIGVGAAFDFMAGTVRRAPRFLQHSGFEWTYRVLQEPRRLWKRYVVANSRFAMLLLAERWRRRSSREKSKQGAALEKLDTFKSGERP
jgi:N-acetylglucosaminyldiphosphoundecaprenol N-acetyl-beta-D-mannosaminyltransferase